MVTKFVTSVRLVSKSSNLKVSNIHVLFYTIVQTIEWDNGRKKNSERRPRIKKKENVNDNRDNPIKNLLKRYRARE